MFQFIGGESPKKKTSGKLLSKDGKLRIDYVATPSREVYRCRTEADIVGDIFVRVSILKDLQISTEVVQVAGDVKPFIGALELEGKKDPNWDMVDFVEDSKSKGNTNKVKGFEYEVYETDATYANLVDLDNLSSIEDFMYRTRTLKEIAREQDINLEWAKKKNYRILRNREEIEEWIRGLDAYDTSTPKSIPVGFDTETSGLNVNRTKLDTIVGLCMSYENHGGVYFPLYHKRIKNVEIDPLELLDMLKPYCDKNSPKAKKLITHNGKFDWGVMKMYDWELNITDDTLTRQALMNIGETQQLLKLKAIAKKELGYDVIELDDLYEYPSLPEIKAIQHHLRQGASCDPITRRKVSEIKPDATARDVKGALMDFRYAEEDFVEVYGPADADFPRLIYQMTQKRWEKEEGKLDFIYNLEIKLMPMLGEQEYYGIRIVTPEIERLNEESKKEMDDLEQKIFALAGKEFKIGGGDTPEVVYDICGVPHHPRYKTKSGNRSVDKHALKYYQQFKNSDGSPKYPIVEYLSRYNKLKTLVSSFYTKLPELEQEGFIFPNYNNIKAETGRLTCSNPNIQQTEPSSREYLVPDSDDYYFMVCDYSQAEYRIMNGLANEEKVVDFFRNDSEADYHILAYANMHGVPYASVTSKQRSEGKVLNFGTSYGLQDKALALALYGDDNEAAQRKAHAAREQYFAGVPKVLEYFEQQRDIAQESHFARTGFGRKRFIKFFAEAEYATGRQREMLIAKGRRVAGNMPVQGLAADVMKISMVRVRELWRKYGREYAGRFGFTSDTNRLEDNARAVLNVHDEVCVQVNKKIHPNIAIKIMKEAMEVPLDNFGIPTMYIGGNVGYNWLDGKRDELEASVELMNRMMRDATNRMENTGEEYDYLADPRTYWLHEITKYNLEVIYTEGLRGYEDPFSGEMKPIHSIDDALKSVRIAKYATHHGSKGKYIVGMVMIFGNEEVWKHYDVLMSDDTRVKNILNRAKTKYLNDFDSAKSSHNLRAFAEFYGDFGGTVLNHVISGEGHEIANVSVTKKDVTITDTDGKEYVYDEKLSLTTEPKKDGDSRGKALEEDFVSLADKVDSMFAIDPNTERITIHCDELSVQGLQFILDLMMPPQVAKRMSNSKLYNVSTKFKNMEATHEAGKVLLADFIPYCKEVIMHVLTGSSHMLKEVEEKVNNHKF